MLLGLEARIPLSYNCIVVIFEVNNEKDQKNYLFCKS